MSSHTPIAGVKDGLNGVLAHHYLSTFVIPVTNVNIIGRPIATSGVRIITESMKQARGFLQQHAILAMVEASNVPAGGLSAAAAAKLQLRILDGATGRTVLCSCTAESSPSPVASIPISIRWRRPSSPQALVPRGVFDDVFFMNQLLDGFRKMQGSLFPSAKMIQDAYVKALVPRGVFDDVFFMNQLLDGFRKMQGSLFPSAKMIQDAYVKGGLSPPSQSTVRRHKAAVICLTTEAFQALQRIQERSHEDPSIHMASLTWTTLSHSAFGEAGQTSGAIQALMLEDMVRFRSSFDNSKALTGDDLPDVAKLAHDAHDFMERTEAAFGARSEWSPELAVRVITLVEKYAYVQSGALETIVRPWMKKRDDEANELSSKLPGDRRLSDDHFHVISAAKPLGRIHKGMRVVIEENMLTLVYSSTGAGRPASAANGHLKFSQDAVMLVHLTSFSSSNSPTDGFTVNEKVTTDDLYGNSTAASVTSQCSLILTDIQHPGKGVDSPTKALMFLVNR
ncbi:unnamed protein product [Ectocarpus sp. CCAP 1310/34]|nr:unnamed protein product [Ectocarpus sp. CCAP 1310/34]